MTTAPTLKQIASQAGCSIAVASSVLNGTKTTAGVRKETRDSIQRIAEELGYRRHAGTRFLQSKRSLIAGVVVQNNRILPLSYPFNYETILGINNGLQEGGYTLSLMRISSLAQDASTAERIFSERLMDGFILVNYLPPEVENALRALQAPLIWVDNENFKPYRCIQRDEYAAGRLIVKDTLQQNTRRILLVYKQHHKFGVPAQPVNPITEMPNPSEAHFSFRERIRGIQKAAEGLPIDVLQYSIANPAPSFRTALKSVHKNDLVIALDTYAVLQLSPYLAEMGLAPGKDFRMACVDDSHLLDETWPMLTRASFNRYDIGTLAAEMLLRLLDKGEEAVPSRKIKPQVIEGETA